MVCHDVPRALALSSEAIEIAEKYDMELWRGYGLVLHAFALALRGELQRSVTLMDQGLASLQSSETGAMVQIHHAMHAQTLAKLGMFDRARVHADAARAQLRSGSERYLWPECQRLLGDYMRHCQGADIADIEAAYQRAVDFARAQGARSWELYAAASLAECWAERGQRADASALLEPLLAAFNQGFQSPGYQAAADLLHRIQLEAGDS